MAHAVVDAAVNTDSWLMETDHKEEAENRQQDAETEANFEHEHGIGTVTLLPKHKISTYCQDASRMTSVTIILGASQENTIMPSFINRCHGLSSYSSSLKVKEFSDGS